MKVYDRGYLPLVVVLPVPVEEELDWVEVELEVVVADEVEEEPVEDAVDEADVEEPDETLDEATPPVMANWTL